MNSHDDRLSAADLVGLLAESDRRNVFAALVLGARRVPEVASATGLDRSEAAMALQKLVAGGLVSADAQREHYEPIVEVFKAAMRTERRVAGSTGDGAGSYFRRGRLLAIPNEAEVRGRVLGLVIDSFDIERTYTEAQVNALCAEWHDDWVGLRRALIDEGLLARDRSGARYDRIPSCDAPR